MGGHLGRHRQLGVHADVEEAYVDAVLAGDHADPRLAGEDAVHHADGDRGRVDRHAVGGHAVVTREDDGADIVQWRRGHLALGGRDPAAELDQAVQGTGRHRQRVAVGERGRVQVRIGWGDSHGWGDGHLSSMGWRRARTAEGPVDTSEWNRTERFGPGALHVWYGARQAVRS
ncbi:hypothetical protein SDC9_111568 [bioreactor metagenome]|uniref:Uncharacterized protein n=1 Tax=bioreactor metagenome TaxID=1076179 RepID=A0A645BGU0_9ZZZZ